jgi:hypothetical protein
MASPTDNRTGGFVGGVVLHLGARSSTREDRLYAVPRDRV